MGNLVQFSVNIAMEATMLVVLVILLFNLLWQRKLLSTTVPLIYITVFNILTLIVQMVEWVIAIKEVPVEYGVGVLEVCFILDYLFSYGITVAFYCYVEALVTDNCESKGIAFNPNKKIKKLIIAWGIVSTLVYAALLAIPSMYYIEEGVQHYSNLAYVILHIVAKFACICALILIFKHRRVIGKHEATISVVFLIIISVLVIVDELCGLCVGRVTLAIFTLVLYGGIDVHKGLLLERREKEIVEWKTQIMLSQMQPHFLYNVLTTISSMCEMENATQARDTVNRFADYFRANLDSLGKEKTVPFEKELEHIKTYLWLEKIRFEDSLNICYEIGPTNFAVPSLTIQPMVENAVKHGILPKEDGGTVTIKTLETENNYKIIIEDDGVGFDINEGPNDQREHVGIENVCRRLEIICDGSCKIQSKKGEGTVVTICIPKGE